MGFFDKFSEFVNSTSSELDKKAKTWASANKLQSQISEAEINISDAITKIGEQYYEAHKDDAAAEYAELCKTVTDSKALIEKLKKELEKLKGIRRCPQCGETVPSDSAFCPKCGTRLPAEEAAAEESEETDPSAEG